MLTWDLTKIYKVGMLMRIDKSCLMYIKSNLI